ncbi:iron efflux ABC transporter ATP-binding subunit FetA [Edaphovirga cremea]|uniref:iron efflux ABC transporter ATP-binding subunit FetA n=1 Tax=Edaphovirga cremea TaxID=2267246 RepID=UPI00398973E9
MTTEPEILRLRDVSYEINGTSILNEVSLSLRKAEFTLITGPSGCGKSTLLKVISSLISPTSGSILLDGKDIDTIAPEHYRQQVSYCFQTPVLFGETVYDNLALPYQIRHQKVDEIKLKEGLTRLLLPHEILNKSINELSGGEKQRIALLRNLQFTPRILLLDEITSALDEDNKKNVNQMIRELVDQQGVAVLWVTHDQNEISHADEVIVMKNHAVESYP